MADRPKPHATGRVPAGDASQRVGVEQIKSRGIDVDDLIEKLTDAAGAESTTCYYYTILRMHLPGKEDYKEICEDARLEDRSHFELITPRIYELGGGPPRDIRKFADRAGMAGCVFSRNCDRGGHTNRPFGGRALRCTNLE